MSTTIKRQSFLLLFALTVLGFAACKKAVLRQKKLLEKSNMDFW